MQSSREDILTEEKAHISEEFIKPINEERLKRLIALLKEYIEYTRKYKWGTTFGLIQSAFYSVMSTVTKITQWQDDDKWDDVSVVRTDAIDTFIKLLLSANSEGNPSRAMEKWNKLILSTYQTARENRGTLYARTLDSFRTMIIAILRLNCHELYNQKILALKKTYKELDEQIDEAIDETILIDAETEKKRDEIFINLIALLDPVTLRDARKDRKMFLDELFSKEENEAISELKIPFNRNYPSYCQDNWHDIFYRIIIHANPKRQAKFENIRLNCLENSEAPSLLNDTCFTSLCDNPTPQKLSATHAPPSLLQDGSTPPSKTVTSDGSDALGKSTEEKKEEVDKSEKKSKTEGTSSAKVSKGGTFGSTSKPTEDIPTVPDKSTPKPPGKGGGK